MINANTYEADIKFPLVTIKSIIGEDMNGLPVELSLELRQEFTEYESETVAHEKTHAHTELSISVWVGGNSRESYGGQCREAIIDLQKSKLSAKEMEELLDIWDRWHLNDLNAGCVHQSQININNKDWTEKAAAETKKCPKGYAYGSQWLHEPLPYNVIKFCTNLKAKLA